MSQKSLYRVIFVNQDQLFEVYARAVSNSSLFGFVEIEELVFGSRSNLVVDPGEDRLKSMFAEVKRSLIPMHSVVRIDEVEKEGQSKITEVKGNVSRFPPMIPGKRDS